MKRSIVAIGVAGALGAVAFGSLLQSGKAQAADQKEDRRADAPRFKVDTSWPKELPNKWIVGQVPGLTFRTSNS